MSSRNTHQTLTPGRLVLLLQPQSGLTELAVVLGSPDMSPAELGVTEGLGRAIGKGARGGGGGGLSSGSGSSSSSSGVGPDRVLWFLVLHAPGPLDTPAADEGAAKAAAVAVGESWGTWAGGK
jgi:hypothetical protein